MNRGNRHAPRVARHPHVERGLAGRSHEDHPHRAPRIDADRAAPLEATPRVRLAKIHRHGLRVRGLWERRAQRFEPRVARRPTALVSDSRAARAGGSASREQAERSRARPPPSRAPQDERVASLLRAPKTSAQRRDAALDRAHGGAERGSARGLVRSDVRARRSRSARPPTTSSRATRRRSTDAKTRGLAFSAGAGSASVFRRASDRDVIDRRDRAFACGLQDDRGAALGASGLRRAVVEQRIERVVDELAPHGGRARDERRRVPRADRARWPSRSRSPRSSADRRSRARAPSSRRRSTRDRSASSARGSGNPRGSRGAVPCRRCAARTPPLRRRTRTRCRRRRRTSRDRSPFPSSARCEAAAHRRAARSKRRAFATSSASDVIRDRARRRGTGRRNRSRRSTPRGPSAAADATKTRAAETSRAARRARAP